MRGQSVTKLNVVVSIPFVGPPINAESCLNVIKLRIKSAINAITDAAP